MGSPDNLGTLSGDGLIEDGGDDLSSSQEELSDVDEAHELQKHDRLKQLLIEVDEDPYRYQQHSEIISLYRELGLYNELKLARERMKALFPLDQAIWLDWLKDEIALAASEGEYQGVLDLFDAAVGDYLAIPIWELYVDYLVERFADGLSLDIVRDRMRQAVLATQYHYGEWHSVWNRVLQFEEHLLDDAPSDAQKKVVQDLYSAHLLIPHNEIEATFKSFSSFVSTHLPPDAYEGVMKAANASYSESLNISVELGQYEDHLAGAAFAWEAYEVYIEFLKSQLALGKNRGVWVQLIKTTYERAVAHHPTTPALWESYAVFLISHFPVSSTFAQVALRGVRNCPWSSSLAVYYLRSLEPAGLEAVEVALEELLKSKLLSNSPEDLAVIFLERCSIAHRLCAELSPEQRQKLRGLLRDSVDKLYEAFPGGDSHYRTLKYWAELESHKLQDVDAARKVWSEIVRRHKNRAKAWLQFVQFESHFGTLKRARGLLAQAFRTLTDDPTSVLVAWEDFERLHGDASSNQQTSSAIHVAQLHHMKRANDAAVQQAVEQAQLGARKERARARNKVNKARKRGSNRKQPSDGVSDLQGTPDSKAQEVDKGEDGSEVKRPRLSECAGTTLFVCNFAPEVDCARLRDLFEKFGCVNEVRRPNSKVGMSRNFAYVEFATPGEARKALELDGHVLERELPLSVKLSDPSQRKLRDAGAQPSPKRLFVTNLPTGIATNAGVLALFSPFGAIEHVRISTDRLGAPNGRAVVEFSQEESGLSALSLNSTLVEGRVITVCIADPSARPKRTRDRSLRKEEPTEVPSLTPASSPKGPSLHPTSFRPRQIAHLQRPHHRLGVSSVKPNPTHPPTSPAKSNQEFRTWLLGNPNKS